MSEVGWLDGCGELWRQVESPSIIAVFITDNTTIFNGNGTG